MHDAYRVDKGGKPTFDRVMRGLGVLKRHGVDWNVLTTRAVHGREAATTAAPAAAAAAATTTTTALAPAAASRNVATAPNWPADGPWNMMGLPTRQQRTLDRIGETLLAGDPVSGRCSGPSPC